MLQSSMSQVQTISPGLCSGLPVHIQTKLEDGQKELDPEPPAWTTHMAQPRCSHGRSPSPFSLRKEFLERQEASREKAAISPSHLRAWQSSTAKKEAGPAAGWEPCLLATTAEHTLPTVLRCTQHSKQLLNLSAHVRS